MASSLASPSAALAAAKAPCTVPRRNIKHKSSHYAVSFRLSPKPKLRIFTRGVQPIRKHSTLLQAQLNESSVSLKVPVDGPTGAKSSSESDVPASDVRDAKPLSDQSSTTLATEESISEFITQVASLVKLVDSRDIVELQLKQLDCEVVIRKKEALPQPAPPASVPLMYASPPSVAQSALPPVPAAVSAPASPVSSLPPSPPATKSVKSSLPPLKCPMAGTFYRSPGPGEPAFVKVGDKVQKGQILCIIEAMKLMNEIEADQSGTITEVLAEDGKPVSVDMPLFIIQP